MAPTPSPAIARRLQAARWLRGARGRVRAALWPVAQTAAAAAAAWYLSHDVLGHAQPFFAPIAAAVSLSAVDRQRGRRAVQMIFGVCLGIGVAELLQLLLGDTAISIGVVAFTTMCVAVATGVGFVGQGMMFVNQASASAILVIALHRTGTGSERLVDALVGGGVALAVSQLLFPPHPLKLLREAEQRLLCTLADALDELLDMLHRAPGGDAMWLLGIGERVHGELAALAQARVSARDVARLTRHRLAAGAVGAEDRRAARLDLLGDDVLGLLRVAGAHLEDDEQPLALDQRRALAELAAALRALRSAAATPEAQGRAREASRLARAAADRSARAQLIASLVAAAAADIEHVAGDGDGPRARPASTGGAR